MSTFLECGWTSWIMTVMTLAAAACGIAAVVLAARRNAAGKVLGGVTLALSLAVVGAGHAGETLGRAKADAATSSQALDPASRVRLRKEFYQEAAGCVEVGRSFSALPFLLGVAALALAFTRKADASRA